MATTTPEPLKAVHASGWLLIAVGVISVIAGLLALAYPDITLLVLGLITGINVLLLGVLAVVSAVAGEGGTGVADPAGRAGRARRARRDRDDSAPRRDAPRDRVGARPVARAQRLTEAIVALIEPGAAGSACSAPWSTS